MASSSGCVRSVYPVQVPAGWAILLRCICDAVNSVLGAACTCYTVPARVKSLISLVCVACVARVSKYVSRKKTAKNGAKQPLKPPRNPAKSLKPLVSENFLHILHAYTGSLKQSALTVFYPLKRYFEKWRNAWNPCPPSERPPPWTPDTTTHSTLLRGMCRIPVYLTGRQRTSAQFLWDSASFPSESQA